MVIGLTAELQHVALIAALIFAAAIGGMVALLVSGGLRDRLLHLMLKPLPDALATRVEQMADAFLGGLGVLSRRGDLAIVAITSLLAWSCEAAMYWTVAQAFGAPLSTAMSVVGAYLTTAIGNLATLVPSGPGYVGTFEAGVLLAVNGALGVPGGPAPSHAVLLHVILWLPGTVWGAIEWWRISLLGRRQISMSEAIDEELDPADTLPGARPFPAQRVEHPGGRA